jgi:hypothetical protein
VKRLLALAALTLGQSACAGSTPPTPHPTGLVRTFALGTPAAVVPRTVRHAAVLPEDGTLLASRAHTFHDPRDDASVPTLACLAEVGASEGFTLVAARTERPLGPDGRSGDADLAASLPTSAHALVLALPIAAVGDAWTEDSLQLDGEGAVRLPPALSAGEAQAMRDAVRRARILRLAGAEPDPGLTGDSLARAAAGEHPEALAAVVLGAVALRDVRQARLETAARLGLAVKDVAAYVEGGDALLGLGPSGQPDALVGRDTLAATRWLLARRWGREPAEAEVRAAVGQALGLPPEAVVPVEQPGVFHLDLAVLRVGPRRVLLNDAREAARLQAGWLESDHPDGPARAAWLAALAADARLAARLEDLAEADMRAAGFEVHRVPGLYREPRARALAGGEPDAALLAAWAAEGHPSREQNFLNAELAVNARGERYMVALGGDPRAEAEVVGRLRHVLGDRLSRLYLLPPDLTAATLALRGGVGCRVRLEGAATAPW